MTQTTEPNCQNEEETLEGLAQAFEQCVDESERMRVANKTSAFLLRSPGAHRMIKAMLFRKGKIPDRLDDALQEATILYVMKVLPSLRNPLAAWGAFKGAVNIVGHRIGASFYDCERSTIMSFDTPLSYQDDDETGQIQMEHATDGGADATERTIIDKMVSSKAKSAINEALLTAKMNGKNALSWLSKLNRTDDAPALPRPEKLEPAPALTRTSALTEKHQSSNPTASNEPQIVPVARLLKKTKAKPKPLEGMPYIEKQSRNPDGLDNGKVPATDEYKRLVKIRDRSGMAIQPFAEALHIGLPRLRSYLNRKSRVHPEVLARAEQWYSQEGIKREKRLKRLKAIPLPELIDVWKESTQAPSYASLAGILGISVPTMSRWRKPGTKPMHDSHLIEAADNAERYAQSRVRPERRS